MIPSFSLLLINDNRIILSLRDIVCITKHKTFNRNFQFLYHFKFIASIYKVDIILWSFNFLNSYHLSAKKHYKKITFIEIATKIKNNVSKKRIRREYNVTLYRFLTIQRTNAMSPETFCRCRAENIRDALTRETFPAKRFYRSL